MNASFMILQKKLFEDELAFSLEKTPKEIEALIHAKLEPLGINKIEKSLDDSDDEYDDDEDFMDDEVDGDVMDEEDEEDEE